MMATAMVPTCTANRLLRPTGSLSASSKPRIGLAPATAVPLSKQHKLASQRGRRSCLRLYASQEAAETLQADSQPGAEVSQAGDASTPAAEFDPYDKLNDWQMLRIVTQDMPDEEVNELVWECLGYVKSYEMDPEVRTLPRFIRTPVRPLDLAAICLPTHQHAGFEGQMHFTGP